MFLFLFDTIVIFLNFNIWLYFLYAGISILWDIETGFTFRRFKEIKFQNYAPGNDKTVFVKQLLVIYDKWKRNISLVNS